MNCQILAVVDSPDAKSMLAQVPTWFEEWEQRFSRFRATSELNRLNAQNGQWVKVSVELCEMVAVARLAAAFSNGLVSPLVLNALEQAGYDRSFEQMATSRVQPAGSAPGNRFTGDWQSVKVDSNQNKVFLPAGARLDFGGIAKGWSAEIAAQRLSVLGAALVDAGGDVAMAGKRSDVWPIAIANPLLADENIELLLIEQGSVATSGRDFRRWRRNGTWQHHIIDPRTAKPAQTDVISATVIAPKMLMAESAAKVVLILGSRDGLKWLESQADLAALLVLENGEIIRSSRMDGYIWK